MTSLSPDLQQSASGGAARLTPVDRALLLAAPAAALLDSIAAEWLDFRALRVPLLLVVGLGVLATSFAATGAQRGRRRFAQSVAIGIATWGLAISGYAVIHAARGESFSFGAAGPAPQPLQALALIGAHALLLGAPAGIAAGVLLHAYSWLRGRRAAYG